MTEKKLSEKEKVVILAGIGIAGAVGVYLAYKVSAKPCEEGDVKTFTCPDGTEITTHICEDGKWIETGDTCPSEPPDCIEGWLDEYQCVDTTLQRKYQNTDCSTEWQDYEFDSIECTPEYLDTTLDLIVSPFPTARPGQEYSITAILKDINGMELIDKTISLDIRDGAGNLIFHKTIASGEGKGTIMVSPFPATHRIMIYFKGDDNYAPSEDGTILGIECPLGYYWNGEFCVRTGGGGNGGGGGGNGREPPVRI